MDLSLRSSDENHGYPQESTATSTVSSSKFYKGKLLSIPRDDNSPEIIDLCSSTSGSPEASSGVHRKFSSMEVNEKVESAQSAPQAASRSASHACLSDCIAQCVGSETQSIRVRSTTTHV
eukprot:scaffold78422_cov53-Cyclotella_meneghiniana.AAC.3